MNNGFVKNINIAEFPCVLKKNHYVHWNFYASSKVLTVITVGMMCHQEIQLGGYHFHKLLCILVDNGNNMSVFKMS